MILDLAAIRAAVTVGGGVAHLVGQLVTHIAAVQHNPLAIADVLADLSDGAAQIVDAVRSGTAAEHEDDNGEDDGVQSVAVKE